MIVAARDLVARGSTRLRDVDGIRYVAHPSFSSRPEAVASLEFRPPHVALATEPSQGKDALTSYFAGLHATPLLSREEESAAFLHYNFLKYQATKAQGEERSRYLAEARQVRDQIVRANLRLVVSIAKRFVRPRVTDLFEIVSEGNVALLRAIESFDVTQHVKFSTYATTAIRRNLIHHRQAERRRESRYTSGLEGDAESTDKRRTSDTSYDPANFPTEQLLLRLVDRLAPRERWLITARFGLGANNNARSFSALGEELGISKERVRQLAHRAISQLRTWAEAAQIDNAACSA